MILKDELKVCLRSKRNLSQQLSETEGPDYYNQMAHDYRERREVLCAALREAGFRFSVPEGAYYVLADFSDLSSSGDREFAMWLAKEAGIATVPGSSFAATPGRGSNYVRFAFCKKKETLERAAERILAIRSLV